MSSLVSAQDVFKKKKKKIKIAWEQHETKNYQIKYEDAIPGSTVEKIGTELEDILEQYVKVFRVKPKKKLKVKFMDSRNTYHQEGGNPSFAGHYNSASKYLIIQQMPFYDLVPTVYHEAFHQYLDMYVGGGVHIPIWFNEGMAEYYGGIQRERHKKNPKLDINNIDFRKIRMVKDKIFTRNHIPLKKLIDFKHEDFHDKDKQSLSYTQSFSVIYFLMKSSKRGKATLPYKFAKELRDTKKVEDANAKLFGKDRKNLKKVEKAWKKFIRKTDIPKA